MSGEFTGTVAALLAGRKVNAALLIEIDWPNSEISRLWTGMYDKTIGGNTYKGAGRLVSVDGLSPAFGTTAPPATFKLSGVNPDALSLAIAEKDQAPGCEISCAVQVFGDGETATEWQPIDAPVQIGSWDGDQLTFERNGPAERSISLTGISTFATRSRALSSYYSDPDQRLRYPQDRGAEFMATLQNSKIYFPFSGSA